MKTPYKLKEIYHFEDTKIKNPRKHSKGFLRIAIYLPKQITISSVDATNFIDRFLSLDYPTQVYIINKYSKYPVDYRTSVSIPVDRIIRLKQLGFNNTFITIQSIVIYYSLSGQGK